MNFLCKIVLKICRKIAIQRVQFNRREILHIFRSRCFCVAIQWIFFAAVLLINTAAALFIAFLLMRRPSAPGLRSLISMLYLLAVWSFGYALITLSPLIRSEAILAEVRECWHSLCACGLVHIYRPVHTPGSLVK